MANYVYIATSLDGYIAASDGALDWLAAIPNLEKTDYGYADFMAAVEALVLGRNTFEKVLTFEEWPYTKPVFVLSSSLTAVPEALDGQVEIVRGEIRELVNDLHQRGYQNLYIDGGLVIQSFLQADLIDEMIITRVPILLGSGFPLFGQLDQRLQFRHKETTIYKNGLVKSHYIRDL